PFTVLPCIMLDSLSFLVHRRPPRPTLFPYTTLFRSSRGGSPMMDPPPQPSPVRGEGAVRSRADCLHQVDRNLRHDAVPVLLARADRKSTRLNSSHVAISYAVFCLKKKIKLERVCAAH